MSEYWKSTPKYWCKFCAVYVRDTKLERTNHESTAKHQSAVKRSLKDLHRSADQAEKEKERARREVERLNGVVSAQGSSSKTATTKQDGQGTAQISQSERQRQLEQLAGLGVAIPTELRGDIAMAGEWSVTSVRVIDGGDGDGNAGEPIKEEETVLVRRAVGVKRAREMTEDEKEREEALNGLFDQNKRRKWGVGSRTMPDGEDEELDALLSGGLAVKKKEEDDVEVKKEEEETRKEPALDAVPDVKTEISQAIKVDGKEAGLIDIPPKKGSEAQAVIFKKRKPKNIRQK